MKKNVARVVAAFLTRIAARDKTIWTDGRILYSYEMPIAVWGDPTRLIVLGRGHAPTKTTAQHANQAAVAIYEYRMLKIIGINEGTPEEVQAWADQPYTSIGGC